MVFKFGVFAPTPVETVPSPRHAMESASFPDSTKAIIDKREKGRDSIRITQVNSAVPLWYKWKTAPAPSGETRFMLCKLTKTFYYNVFYYKCDVT